MLIKSLVKTTRKTFISLDPDTDQYYVLTPQPIKKDPPLLFEPTQVQTSISPNTFTAHSDNTLQLLGKTISYEFMSKKQSSELLPENPYRSLRIGLLDFMLNLTPFFYPNGSLVLLLSSLVIPVIF